jgi:hypothetical protein
MHYDTPFSLDDRQAWYSFVIVQDGDAPRDKDETGKIATADGTIRAGNGSDRSHRSDRQFPSVLPVINRLVGRTGATLRALAVACALIAPLALVGSSPAGAETVIRPQGGGPVFQGIIGPWEFYKVEYSDGVVACSMVGWVGRKKAPTFSLAAYYTKAGKFDGNEIRFEGAAGSPPTGSAAKAQLQIGGKAFAMEHPEKIAHSGFFLKDWNQFDAVIAALSDLSVAKGNRSFLVVQGGRNYKFDARDFGKALGRLKEKCGFGK